MRNLSYVSELFGVAFASFIAHPIVQAICLAMVGVSTAFSVALTVSSWFKKAKEDGKITKEEVSDLFDKIKEDINKKGDK